MKGYNKFKQFLLEQGIKQEEVATLLGMSRSQLNMILNGQRDNDFLVSQMIKLCEHYNISADHYFIKDTRTISVPIKSDATESN